MMFGKRAVAERQVQDQLAAEGAMLLFSFLSELEFCIEQLERFLMVIRPGRMLVTRQVEA
jgi:hypothetical protein